MTQTQRPLPRGIRNNNPGNIRHSGAHWHGQAHHQPDANFVTFTSPEYGIRAIARILMNYQTHYNLNTIEQLIHRWAPPNENLTDPYVRAVSRAAGVRPSETIDLRNNPDLFRRVVTAIIVHENGAPTAYGLAVWYDQTVIDRGIRMALQSAPHDHEDRSHHHRHRRDTHQIRHARQVPPSPTIVLP
jgi:hypothetical protein